MNYDHVLVRTGYTHPFVPNSNRKYATVLYVNCILYNRVNTIITPSVCNSEGIVFGFSLSRLVVRAQASKTIPKGGNRVQGIRDGIKF